VIPRVSVSLAGRQDPAKVIQAPDYRLVLELASCGRYRHRKNIQEKLVGRDYRRVPNLMDIKRIRVILEYPVQIGARSSTTKKPNIA
jgi:hypothetical protein